MALSKIFDYMSEQKQQLGRRVPRAREQGVSDGTIRVSADGHVSSYINYATKLVNEEGRKQFVVAGTGTALENTVRVSEVIKRSFPMVHQLTTIGVREFKEQYESKEEGSDNVEVTRVVPYMEITFSLNDDLDKKNPGYQAPIDQSLVNKNLDELINARPRSRLNSGRGGNRGGRRTEGGEYNRRERDDHRRDEPRRDDNRRDERRPRNRQSAPVVA